MRTGIIYKVTNIINNKCYIGQTLQKLSRRMNSHLCSSFDEKYIDYNIYFHRAIRKYGREAFMWEIILDNIPIEDLNMYERFYIALYSTFGEFGYNGTNGGESGRVFSQEVKDKMSKAKIGNSINKDIRLKLSISHRGRKKNKKTNKKCNVVCNCSEEMRLKRSAAAAGENNPTAKLTAERVMEIRIKYASNKYTQSQLSIEYGVSRANIGYIVRNETWKETDTIEELNQ